MIRIGIVGAGPNGTGNAKNLAAHEDRCSITAVADPNVEAAKTLADCYGAKAVSDMKDILDAVDAVVISSPNFLHREHTLAAAEAGRHVWIEKPMALSVADADVMVEAVGRAGVASMIGFSVRFSGIVRKMKEIYTSGQIGDLLSLWSRRLCFFDPATRKGWRFDYSKSGGVMAELLVHEIDWIVDIAGDPNAVYCRKASRYHDDPRDNEHIWLTLSFEGDTTGTIEGSQMSLIADYHRGIVGTKGSAATRNWGGDLFLQTEPKKADQVEPAEGFDKHGHFLDVIEGKCESVADVSHGRKIVLISEKAVESAVTGQVVRL